MCGSYDKTIRLWDTMTGALTATLDGHESGVNCVCFSPDWSNIASGSTDKNIRVWDAANGTLISTLVGHEGVVRSVL